MIESARVVGMFMGSAVGDALGAPVEFKRPGSFAPVSNYRRCDHFNLPAGGWTDDTSMSWALAESLIAHNGVFNEADVMKRWISWMETGEYSHTGTCFDIGNQTSRALRAYNGRKLATSERALGNGCIMRMAPLAAVATSHTLWKFAERQCWLTHPSDKAVDACVDYSMILDQFLRTGASDRLEEMANHWGLDDPDNPPGAPNGTAEAALHAAVWAVWTTMDFSGAVLSAVNMGDDADTVGAITGAIAGAKYGFDRIRAPWIKRLAWSKQLRATADRLAALAVS